MFWKRKKKHNEFKCSECGKTHAEWPALGFLSPANYDFLSDSKKNEIGKLDQDFCEIHNPEHIDRFIRVTLFQKVNNACQTLDYGLWVSLSQASYSDYKLNFNNPNHETGYFGWLCSNIPEYGDTINIPCNVITKTGNSRPEIIPHEDFDHPLVRDYYNGISESNAKNRIKAMMNSLD